MERTFTALLISIAVMLTPLCSSAQLPAKPDAQFILQRLEQLQQDKTLDEAVKKAHMADLHEALSKMERAEKYRRELDLLEQQHQQALKDIDAQRQNLYTLRFKQPKAFNIPSEYGPSHIAQQQEQLDERIRVQQQELERNSATLQKIALRQNALPKELKETYAALTAYDKDFDALRADWKNAKALLHYATATLHQQRQQLLEQELRKYPLLHEYHQLRKDIIQLQLQDLRREATFWQKHLAQNVAERFRRELSRYTKRSDQLPPHSASALTMARIIETIKERMQLAAQQQQQHESKLRLNQTLQRLTFSFETARHKHALFQRSPAFASFLRKEKSELPSLAEEKKRLTWRQGEIERIKIRINALHGQRRSRLSTSATSRSTPPAPLTAEQEQLNRQLYAHSDALLDELNEHFYHLLAMDAQHLRLIEETTLFIAFIEQHVLWVPSHHPPRSSDGLHMLEASGWLFGLENWTATFSAVSNRYIVSSLLLILIGFVQLFSRRMRRNCHLRLAAMGQIERSTLYCTPTSALQAIAYTLLQATPEALLTLLLGALVHASSPAETGHAVAIAYGLYAVSLLLFFTGLATHLNAPGGYCALFQVWHDDLRELLHHYVPRLKVLLPAIFIVSALQYQPEESYRGSLGRLAFICMLFFLIILFWRMAKKGKVHFVAAVDRAHKGWMGQWYNALFTAGGALLLAPVVLSAIGYYDTALTISSRLILQLGAWSAMFIIYTVFSQWVIAVRKRIADHTSQEEHFSTFVQEHAIAEKIQNGRELGEIGLQSRKIMRYGLLLMGIASIWLIWADVFPALLSLNNIRLWTVKSADAQQVITLMDAALACVLGILTIISARNLPGLLDVLLLHRLPFDMGMKFAIVSVTRYSIVIIGIGAAFANVGVSWSTIQWLAAAITVGLGFGLQEIFANFVSGIIMLFERPVRIGDVVTVGDISGTVVRIQMRATTILDWDRKELIVPNKEFITARLVNWSLSDDILRIVITVGVAYGSDTAQVEQVLREVASTNEHVLSEPPPMVVFKKFDDSSLTFELRVFVPNIDHYIAAIHSLHMQIDSAFKNSAIQIAFPQLDVHMHTPTGNTRTAATHEE